MRVAEARRQAVSVSVATGLYGLSFGAMSIVSGLDLAQTMVLSLLMFSGGSQFAFAGVVGSGGSPGAAIAASTLLGMRNMVYGPLVTPVLPAWGWRRAAAAQLTIDESTAVAVAQPDTESARVGFWWTGIGVYVLWNSFVLGGALLGDNLGDPRRFGLDAAAAAAFLGLVWGRLRDGDRITRWTAVGSAGIALAATPVLPPGMAVLATAALALGVAWVANSKVAR